MSNRAVIVVTLSFLLLLLFPRYTSAANEYEISKLRQRAEDEHFAVEYIKDHRAKIGEEKYETLPKIFEKFHLQQAGSVRNETAVRVSKSRKLTKMKNQLILSETGRFSDNLRFKASGRFWYDAVFDLTNNFSKSAESDQEAELELRDTYIDYSNGPFDLRLGKQQIVWGEAVALFFADVVNAKDLREFILPDFDLIRIPQWGADVEYSKDKFHAEFFWLPILEFDKLGVTGSEFFFPYPLPSATTPFTIKDPIEPKDSLKNSETGLRLSYLVNGWDISGFYLYTWTRSPVYYRTISGGVYNFSPSYKRLNVFGMTFAKEIKDIVLKGEFVFNKDDYFSIFDTANLEGIVRRNVLNYLLGLDYTFFSNIDVAFQFMQRVIFDYPELLANEEKMRNSLAIWLKTDLFDGKLEPEFTAVTSLMEEDVMYRPRVSYKFNDNWSIRIGADIFQGRATGTFGKFDKKSRVYCETSYKF